jgi:hypothetical protein
MGNDDRAQKVRGCVGPGPGCVIISLRNFGQLLSGDLVSRPGRCQTHPPVHSNAQRAWSALPALGHKGALYHILWSWVLEDQVPVEKLMAAALKQSPASALKTIKSKNRQIVQEIKPKDQCVTHSVQQVVGKPTPSEMPPGRLMHTVQKTQVAAQSTHCELCTLQSPICKLKEVLA